MVFWISITDRGFKGRAVGADLSVRTAMTWNDVIIRKAAPQG